MEQVNNFSELLKLESGKRYTVIVKNSMGLGVNAIQFTLHEAKIGRYSSYEECVELVFTPKKKKRDLHSLKFARETDVALFEGWVEVDTDPFSAPEDQGIMTIRSMKYSACDSRFMDDAIASVKATPLFLKRFNNN
ncbi:MAG: hypothetical protein KF681_14800 [Bdellovibrionaceae bacterium]|nr:hypothetical protein [Pseudobdellovibrionaceae bacterium]